MNKLKVIDLINSNELIISDELEIFEVIWNKYAFKTISEYAKMKEKTYQGIVYQINNGLLQNIEVGSVRLIFD
jgi:hypothetical protein